MADPKGDDVLLPFEQKKIPEHYRPYYAAKRHNFFAGVQGSPDLWRYYSLLDKILLDEFLDMGTTHDPGRMIPLALFFNAHAKIRVSIELAFERCMEEARSIMRDSIETAVYAHYMLADQKLQKIWLSKDDGDQARRDFSQAFEKEKKTRLFRDLPELYEKWSDLCETGAHSTPQAVVGRFKITEGDQHVNFQMNYTGVEDRVWEPETFTLLLTAWMLEQLLFKDCQARLQFDESLMRNRMLAERFKEKLRRDIIKRHNIQSPTARPTKPS